MTRMRAELPPLPPKMAHLPIDKRGYPTPYFVALVNGEPDHRVADAGAMRACVQQNRCWLCGGVLGRYKAFTIGPMCSITRTISEPPQHLECSIYAATACPFLTRPHAKRREAGMPEEAHAAAGNGIMRNPGAVCVWVTLEHKVFRSVKGNEGLLFDIGEPEATYWFAEGREATRAEVDASIESGLPLLLEMAQLDGEDGLRDLDQRVAAVKRLLDVTLPATTSTEASDGRIAEHQ